MFLHFECSPAQWFQMQIFLQHRVCTTYIYVLIRVHHLDYSKARPIRRGTYLCTHVRVVNGQTNYAVKRLSQRNAFQADYS